MSNLQRMMLFIDGENIVFRYQAMKDKGFIPHKNVVHKPDVYVWSTKISMPGQKCHVIRAYYYTSVSGDNDKIEEVVEQIKSLGIIPGLPPGSAFTLYPIVYKKPRQSDKTKGVDIRMTTDILTHVYQDNLDVAYLFTGDGDYVPVVNEVIRRGKMVYIAAFSDGLNPKLKQTIDGYQNLDSIFFDLSNS